MEEGSATNFLAFALRLRKILENLRKPLGSLSSVAIHCFNWGSFPPNEVGKAMLSAPPAKSIRPSRKSVLKNFEVFQFEDPRNLGSSLQVTLQKFSS